MSLPKRLTHLTLAAALVCGLGRPAAAQELLTQPGSSPLVDVSLQFRTGAAEDPAGAEGTAYLVANSLSQGATQAHTYDQLLGIFYPWAVEVGNTVDKEVVTFTATVHKDHLADFTPIFVEMMTRPKFAKADLDRLRDKAENYLTQDLRSNNDEELGKEALYLEIYPKSHPYGHHDAGSISGLESLDEARLKAFYNGHFTAGNFVLGVAGGYPEGYPEKLRDELVAALPAARPAPAGAQLEIPKPASPDGRRVTIVEKDTRSVAMSMGFPIGVTRSHPDWTALNLVRSYLGEHRSSNSHLYQRLREARGLNYGDYAYIEYFPNGMFLFQPEPYYPRSEEIFQVWIRPVQPETAVFTLRAALYELDKLVENGMTQEEFEATRSFLSKNAPLLVASSGRRLGYAMDSRFYHADPYVERVRKEMAALTLEDVNAAIRRHIHPDDMEIVLVSKNAEKLRGELLKGDPSPMTYNSPKPEEILAEDKVIQNYPMNLGEVLVVPVDQMFR
jgi:zinc protease